MKRGANSKERKAISARGLLSRVKKSFKKTISFKDRKGKLITPIDCLMSAVAMFSLKSKTLLAFDKSRNKEIVKNNLETLYGVKNVPCDTYMREVLDEIDPRLIRKSFLSLFSAIQRGKMLEQYKFLDGYLLAVDGSEIFESNKIHCKNCCQRLHQNGKIGYYHQILSGVIVHPNNKQVIPLCPEPITKQDGKTKNDCEINALNRFLIDLKREHPRLKCTVTLDALFANSPQIHKIKSLGLNFIVAVKPQKNKNLFEWIKGIELSSADIKDSKNRYEFRYINQIPLNDSKDTPNVNFLECKAFEGKGKKIVERKFTFITDHHLTKNTVFSIMKGGRSKWKIENETFNTLKNQDYKFEHNFGHGKKNLHTIFAMIMMLAFLIDQAQEAACGLFNISLREAGSRRELWGRLKHNFYVIFFDSWEQVFHVISPEFKGFRIDST